MPIVLDPIPADAGGSLLTFRDGLKGELETDLPAYPWRAGFIAPGAEIDVGCVYSVAEAEATNVQEADLEVRVRVYKAQTQVLDLTEPQDEGDLLAIAESLKAALRDKQTVQWGVWFFRVTRLEIEPRERWIEATCVARTWNTFTVF